MTLDFPQQPEPMAVQTSARRTHALFVCSLGRMRSLTAEHVFATRDDLHVAAAGVNASSEHPVTEALLMWADIVFVMEDVHRSRLVEKFPDAMKGRQVISLGIPDRYEYLDPQLVRLLKTKVDKVLGR